MGLPEQPLDEELGIGSSDDDLDGTDQANLEPPFDEERALLDLAASLGIYRHNRNRGEWSVAPDEDGL